MNKSRRGDITEAKVVARLMELGVSVAESVGDSDKYDIIVDDGTLHRVQVKTGYMRDGKVIFKCESSTRVEGEKVDTPYSRDDVDAFAVYSPEMDEYYWIPFEETPKRKMQLRVADADHEHARINWHDDYLMDERFK